MKLLIVFDYLARKHEKASSLYFGHISRIIKLLGDIQINILSVATTNKEMPYLF